MSAIDVKDSEVTEINFAQIFLNEMLKNWRGKGTLQMQIAPRISRGEDFTSIQEEVLYC